MKRKGFTLHPKAYSLRPKNGFTLIELLVVISIIGVLSTVIFAALGRAKNKAVDARYVRHARELQKTIEIFSLDNDRWPSSGDENVALTGYPIASNCSNIFPEYNNNWDDFVLDMGTVLPSFFAEDGGQRPECYFYTIWPSTQCPNSTGASYILTFGTTETIFEGIDSYVDTFGDRYHCLREL